MKNYPVLTVAAKEYIVTYRDKVVVLLAVITWLLLAAGAYTGLQQQKQASQQRERAARMFLHEWEEQEANPHSAAHFGTYLFKPAGLLSVYDYGLNRYLGVSYRVEAHVQHEVNQAEAQTTDSQLRFGEMSVSMVLQLIMPLLIMLITFNSFTREREGSTLGLLLVQGIRPRSLVWGKVLGNYAVVLSIVLPAFILMGLAVFFQEGYPDDMARYGIFSAAYLVYFFVITGIGILISAWSRTSNAALVSCIGLWFLMAVLVPRLAVRLVDENNPLPSRFELNRRIAEGYTRGLDGDGTRMERHQKYLESILKKYRVDSVNQLPVNFDGLAMQYGEDYNTKVYQRYAGEVELTIQKQQKRLDQVSLLNPFMAIRQMSMGLSGSDYYHHQSFHHQAREYRNEFIRVLNMDLANSGSKHLSYDYKAGPGFFKKMKDFIYVPPPVSSAMAWHSLAGLALATWCLLIVFLINVFATRLIKYTP